VDHYIEDLTISPTLSPDMELLFDVYPDLNQPDNQQWLEILERATLIEQSSGNTLVRQGSSCNNFLFLLDGTVRVFQMAEDGREMTLYRINPGDVCLMSLSSLLNDKPFKANAATDSCIRALMLSVRDFHLAMKVSDAFRIRVLRSLVNSVCEIMHSFYDTAFEPLELRLACLLGGMFERSGSNTLDVTHQQLALELGTSREVVSRILKRLEKRQCISLSRAQIMLGSSQTLPWTPDIPH
jgi:CRP/FNR family transcriptional regulator